MKLMIEELSYINFNDCNINIDKIKKYKNILKFILKKKILIIVNYLYIILLLKKKLH